MRKDLSWTRCLAIHSRRTLRRLTTPTKPGNFRTESCIAIHSVPTRSPPMPLESRSGSMSENNSLLLAGPRCKIRVASRRLRCALIDRDDDFALGVSLLEIGDGLRRFSQWITAIDDGS